MFSLVSKQHETSPSAPSAPAASSPTTTTATTTAAPAPKAVKVVIRMRPMLPSEKKSGEPVCARVASPTVIELTNHRNAAECIRYQFDSCLDETCTQKELFEREIAPLLNKPFAGMSTTVFAFGPTSSGKSFTMLGGEQEESKGIIPRAVAKVFETIKEMPPTVSAKVLCSYFEIYNERLFDLFGANREEVQLREDLNRSIIIAGLQEIPIAKYEDFQTIFAKAVSKRTSAATKLNDLSSRSHSILRLRIECNNGKSVQMGKLYLIDLAGSEDNRRTDNAGVRMKESGAINKSLFVLGNVIDALNSNQSRIPYRDSKLTRVLQDSLGGNSVSCMLTNIAPCQHLYMDIYTCLNYASKSKQIINKPFVTSVSIPSQQQHQQQQQQRRPGFAFKRSHDGDQPSGALHANKKVSLDTEKATSLAKPTALNSFGFAKASSLAALSHPAGRIATLHPSGGTQQPPLRSVLAPVPANRLPNNSSSNPCQPTPKTKRKLTTEHISKAQEFAKASNKHGALIHYKKALLYSPEDPALALIAAQIEDELEQEDGVMPHAKSTASTASAGVPDLPASTTPVADRPRRAAARKAAQICRHMDSERNKEGLDDSLVEPEASSEQWMDIEADEVDYKPSDISMMEEETDDSEASDAEDKAARRPFAGRRKSSKSSNDRPRAEKSRLRKSIAVCGSISVDPLMRLSVEQTLLATLNTGELKDLMGLSGIGEKRAKTILEFRQKGQYLTQLADLRQIPGFGQKFADSFLKNNLMEMIHVE